MNPILRRLLYLALLFFMILTVIYPYNWFCKMSAKCDEIVYSNWIPTTEGNRQITALMEVHNKSTDIDFEVDEPKMLNTVSGRKNQVFYRIQNISNHKVKFRPQFLVEPKEFAKFVSRDGCLCFKEYTIKQGEELILPVSFKFKSKINDEAVGENLIVRLIYKAENN